ncbi:heavy metal-binding domain-containing protein [Dyadobacter arcticus]|uniref:Cu2+-exporting ATPase n=1 Tax=Dyadobacter arcticus TaxID=1078754 RepID=A0ABX0UU62_9BACT|nr:heavy metal-binding domain-containing protein [Dyadobacter arcticus]NIJ55769.1 Cu2+-exporting ATPase [Dyadobacter arcticus]
MNKVLLAGFLLLNIACTGNSGKSEQKMDSTATTAEAKKYACPMNCEGDKTYAEAGKCPVCKMDLQEVALAETDSTSHNH